MLKNHQKTNKLKLTALLLSMSLILFGCETEEEAAAENLQKGKELLEKGDYVAAKLALKSANKGEKSTAETYYYLALLDEKVKHYLAMQDNLKKALDLEPTHYDARLKLGQLELMMGEQENATRHVNILLEKDAENIQALILQSYIFLRQKELDKATVNVARILEAEPANIDGLSLHATLLMQEKQLDEALVVIDKAIKLDEKNISLHALKIKIHGQQGNNTAVTDDYVLLTTLFPENTQYKITLARIYAQDKEFDKAEEILTDLVAQYPNKVQFKTLLLEFYEISASEKLITQRDLFITEMAKKPKQLFDLSVWILAKRDIAKATEILTQVATESANSKVGLEAKILLAKIAFDTKNYVKAKKIAAELLVKDPNLLDAKLLEIKLLLINEQYAEAKSYLDKAIWTHPKSDKLLVLLAQYYLVQKDKQNAYMKFEAALSLNGGNLQAFIPLYNRAMINNETVYARQLLLKGLQWKPKEVVLLQKFIELNIQEENWTEATELVSNLAKLPRQLSLSRFYMANIAQQQMQYKLAIDIYKSLIVEYPEHQQVLKNMSVCYDKLKKRSEMFEFLQAQLKLNSDNTAAALVLSDLYVANKQYKKAMAVLSELIERQPEALELRLKLAEIYLDQGKLRKAIVVYQQGLQVSPGNVKLSIALATLYEQERKYTEAKVIYENLHVENPKLEFVANNLAVLLVDHFKTEDNIQRAFQLVESFAYSEQVYFQDTYAWVLLQMGKDNKALEIFKKLIVKAPDVASFRYHLSRAEFNAGNNSKALVQLEQALYIAQQGGDFPEKEAAKKLMQEITQNY